MSDFLVNGYKNITPYVPGEQPRDKKYIKLNTNESPFCPPESVMNAVAGQVADIQLYSDPELLNLRRQMSDSFNMPIECIAMTNGSDEALNLAFMAFADKQKPLAFADITYGFYKVIAELNAIPYTLIPLSEDLSVCADDYVGINKTIVIANPNAPTGKYLEIGEIEKIVKSNPENIIIIDEAYIDFGGESAAALIGKYNNLIVIGTFSKSRSMAGARLGYVFAAPEIIADINAIRYSMNPFNVNAFTEAAGIAVLKEQKYFDDKCDTIKKNRSWTQQKLRELGFDVIDSMTNFVFAMTEAMGGKELYLKLKDKGVLVRHFDSERIKNYNRITIGTIEQMRTLIGKIEEILEEKQNEEC